MKDMTNMNIKKITSNIFDEVNKIISEKPKNDIMLIAEITNDKMK